MWVFVVGVLLVGGGSGGFTSTEEFPTEEACQDFAKEGLADVAKYLSDHGMEADKVTAVCIINDANENRGDPV